MGNNSFDENNLLYVRKTYETEVSEKARRIFADNTVITTLDKTNKELDELISEMNAKLGFVTDKIVGAGGVEEYVKDVHNQIDNTAVDPTKLVDPAIVNTESHPSITAFKNNRSETKFKNYDFINKTIDIGFKDESLRFYNNTDIKSTDHVHTFEVNLDSKEKIKIVEFSFTYSQFPSIVKIIEGETYKEPTVQVNRVFNGRFFIIRHDPVNAPDEIIVKAVVENADNTGNIIDEYSIDVKKSNIEDVMSLKNEFGPTFDIYFRIISAERMMISIGNINPYKFLIKKNYIESNKQIIDNFNLIKSGISNINFDKIFYSANMGKIFIVDETVRKIYMVSSIDKFTIENITFDNTTVYDKLSCDGFFVKDVGIYTFIGDNTDHCLVYTRDSNEYKDLNVNVEDVQLMSTNEIVVQVSTVQNGRKFSHLYSFNYSTTSLNSTVFAEFHMDTINPTFVQQNKFIEFEPGKIILVSNSKEGMIYYKFIRIDNTSNTYGINAAESATVEQEIQIEDLLDFNVKDNGTSLNIYLFETGVLIHLNSESYDGIRKTVILSLTDLTINAARYIFNKKNVLKKYNYNTSLMSELSDYIKTIIPTSLFIFGISSDNKLLIIDDKYVVDALNFTPVEENGEPKGYTDKYSMLYMKPMDNESEYYLIDKPYLQNIKNIYQSYKGNIYILDAKGLYELTANKNLVCKFCSDTESFTDVILNRDVDSYIVSKTANDKFNIFYHDFSYDESSSKKLRYKYFDLVNGNYIKYDEESDYSNYNELENIPLIEFKAKLYCTLVDKLSPIYNSKDIKNISYTNSNYTFNDINPSIEHYVSLEINGESNNKNVSVTKFSLSTNKYGFINYHGFTLINNSNISDVNSDNLYVLIHKSGDNLSIDDYRRNIYRLIKEQATNELDKFDNDGNLKHDYKISVSVTKNYKNVNKNQIVATNIDNGDQYNIQNKIIGTLLSNGLSFIRRNKLYDKINFNTKTFNLPVSFRQSIDDENHFGLKIDPFDFQYNNVNYFAGFDTNSDNNELVVVKENEDQTDYYKYTIAKRISNVLIARKIKNELYYSKRNGGLYRLDTEMNEIEIISQSLGYIFYDLIEIDDEVYGISNKALLVKINVEELNTTPTNIILERNALSYKNTEIVANIYKFESSDRLIIRLAHTSEKCDYYTPFIYAIPSRNDLSKYITLQTPFTVNNDFKLNDLDKFINYAPDFIYDFVEINNNIYAYGSSVFKFDINTYEFETMIHIGNYAIYDKLFVSDQYSQYANKLNYDNSSPKKVYYIIKSPYSKGYIIPSDDNSERIKMIIDDCSIPIAYDKYKQGVKPLIAHMSNNLISNKKYKMEVTNCGEVFVDGENKIPKTFTISDFELDVYKKTVSIVRNPSTGINEIKDPLSQQPITLFKLDHKKCRWNSLTFDHAVQVGSLIDAGLKIFKYVVDDNNRYEKVDISINKYPVPGIQYYKKNVVGSYDSYERVASNITKWEANALGTIEYYEVKHHYELMTDDAEIIPTDSYVFTCENLYFANPDINSETEGIITLPTFEEYYLISNVSKNVILNTNNNYDERSVIILNDDKILLRSSINGYIKTLIYDTFKNNNFNRHDVWADVYPKAGFEIRRIWEFSDKKFAVIKFPCYDYYSLCLISDDLQQIQCKLDYEIDEPECVHMIETTKEILVSITNSTYDTVSCFNYNILTNKFILSDDPFIFIDSVVIDGKTYLAGIMNVINQTNNEPVLGLYITNENKEVLLALNNGNTVPLYSTTRNIVKQFDNVFIKRYNSEKDKEEAYVFFKINRYNPRSENKSDALFDCIYLTKNNVELKDLHFNAGIKSDLTTFTNDLITPDNKIFIITKNYTVISIDESEKIDIISREDYKEYYPFVVEEEALEDELIDEYHGEGALETLDETALIENTHYNKNLYAISKNKVYLIDESVDMNVHPDITEMDIPLNNETYTDDIVLKVKYNYYLSCSEVNIAIRNDGNPLDIYETRLNYIYDEYTTDILKNTVNSRYFITLPRQKILPVAYKDTMIFGTSIMNESTGKPSTNWFALYDSDKTTLINNFICFDYMFVTKSGKMFGVYNTSIYENDDVLSSNKWFRVPGGSAHKPDFIISTNHTDENVSLAYNTFKKMIETNYGIFYFDSKNILKYNEEEGRFESVKHDFDLTNNVLNFAESFETGLFIGNKRDHKFEIARAELGFGELDIPSSTTGINFNYYEPKSNEFVQLIPNSALTSNSQIMGRSRIVSIRDTSKGVFVLYCDTASDYKNTIYRCYMSINNVMTWEECKYKSDYTFTESFLEFDENDHITGQYPCNLKQIWEDEDTNTIWISGNVYNAKHELTHESKSISKMCGAWSYSQFTENDNGDYRHNHGNNFRFEPFMNKNGSAGYIRYNYADKQSLFIPHDGMEDIIETEHFGKFTSYITGNEHSEVNSDNRLAISRACKVICSGDNKSVVSTSVFNFERILNLRYVNELERNDNFYPHEVLIKEINGKLFMIVQEFGYSSFKFIMYKYNETSNEWVSIFNIPVYDEQYTSDINRTMKGFRLENLELVEYNGILYVKDSYLHDIYILDNYKFDGIESSPEVESNDVLYELRAIFDNQNSYNNLVEKTENSNLDKFVFKEIGIVDGVTGEAKHIFQYFEPNEFYNGSDGVVKPLIESPREFNQSNTIKELYKNIYQKFNAKNLINNRFIKDDQTLIADGFKHEVHEILGDVEDYLTNTDNVRMELKIYPTEVISLVSDLIQPSKFGIETINPEYDNGIDSFDPYD